MKIRIEGQQSVNKLGANIKEIIKKVQEKTGLDDLTCKIECAEVTVVFVKDKEPQYLTVNHDGVNEIFTVACMVDKKGNIEKAVDNEEKSFLDEYTRALAKGEVKEYPVIESKYDDSELEEKAVTDGGDMREVAYTHKETGDTVIRYYKNGELIGELTMPVVTE